MKSRHRIAAVAVAVALVGITAGGMSGAAPVSAHAGNHHQTGNQMFGDFDPPNACARVNSGSAIACFEHLGDKLWVKDNKADGHHAAAQLGDDGTWGGVHFICHNYYGAGTWARCSDWADHIPEHRWAILDALVMEGSRVEEISLQPEPVCTSGGTAC